jgi:hypothetical protein
VGSLLRPPELLNARQDPNTTHERFTAVEDRCAQGLEERLIVGADPARPDDDSGTRSPHGHEDRRQ